MKTKLLIAALFAGLVLSIEAQESSDPKLNKFFEKSITINKFLAQKDEDFWKNSKALMYQYQGFKDGHGMYVWPPAAKEFPKKVGLLTFLVFDPGMYETTSKKMGYLTLVKTTSGALKASTTKEMAKILFQFSIDGLKKTFHDFGSELLSPDEFLTSDQLKESYRDFSFKESGIAKWLSSESGANTLAVPEGFSMYYAENLTMPAYVDAITAKIKELGLDAGLVVKIQLGAVDQSMFIQSVSSVLYGPNPVPKDPNAKYVNINPATGYHEGVVYNGIKLGAFDTKNMLETKEGLNILVFARSKNAEMADFSGFDNLLNKIVGGTCYSFNMWVKGNWKPFKFN
jgi:hypothetical protein